MARFDRIGIRTKDGLYFYRNECKIIIGNEKVRVIKPVKSLQTNDFKCFDHIEGSIKKLKLYYDHREDVKMKLSVLENNTKEVRKLVEKEIGNQEFEYKREEIEILYPNIN